MYKAQKQDAVSFELINLRDFGIGLNKLTTCRTVAVTVCCALNLFAAVNSSEMTQLPKLFADTRGKLWKQAAADWSMHQIINIRLRAI